MESLGSDVNDIGEEFCQCPICIRHYTEPKLLPCLHRCCKNCLKQRIKENQDIALFSCPECKEEFPTPREGVDGFKTDVILKTTIDCLKLQKQFEDTQMKQCCDCSNRENMTAYCFKCNGLLCKKCQNYHLTKRSLIDHKQHTLSLQDLKSKMVTLEHIARSKKDQICKRHADSLARLCCQTCSNLPICITCAAGSHKDHIITDVTMLASEERELLNSELTSLNQCKEKVVKIGASVERTKTNLISNVKDRKESYQRRYDIEVNTMRSEMKDIQDGYERDLTVVEDIKNEDLKMARRKFDKDIEEIRKAFDEQCDNIVKEAETKLKDTKQKHDELYEENDEKLKTLERDLTSFMTIIDKKQTEGLEKIENVSRQLIGTKKRLDNVSATAHSVLVKINDWIALETIPDIRTAIRTLSVEMKREFPQLESLSRIQINVEITEDEHSPIRLGLIDGVKTNKWYITGITSSGDGRIVITGPTSVDYESHITVIDMTGRVLLNKRMNGSAICSYRFCSFLSQFNVITVSWYNEIGVYDVRDGSYSKKNMSDIIGSWPTDRYVTCVATDPVKNHILVGSDANADVFVFDVHLNYRYTLTLPQIIEYPEAMAVSKGDLMVCDSSGKAAYMVITGKGNGELRHRFSEPDFDGDDWTPISICTDKNDFIYILWRKQVSDEWTCCLLQYSQDGDKTLSARPVSSNARCVISVAMGRSEMLLLATFDTGSLYAFSLNETFAFGSSQTPVD